MIGDHFGKGFPGVEFVSACTLALYITAVCGLEKLSSELYGRWLLRMDMRGEDVNAKHNTMQKMGDDQRSMELGGQVRVIELDGEGMEGSNLVWEFLLLEGRNHFCMCCICCCICLGMCRITGWSFCIRFVIELQYYIIGALLFF